MNVLLVASEMAPYAKTGGLGDVVGALPKHLRRLGHDVRVVMPLFASIDTSKVTFVPVGAPFDVVLGAHRYTVRIFASEQDPQNFFVHCPAVYDRGSLYTNDPDEHRRFLVLCHAAMMAAQRMQFKVDILHCNDWQTALMPLMLKVRYAWDRLFAQTKTLLSIHNLNYQGTFPASVLPETQLADAAHLFHQDQLHHPQGGRINFMLHGLLYADGINTVSPTYAKEIQTPEHGAGLDPFLRARKSTVVGILNGVDYDEWSPELDRHIAFRYSADTLDLKEKNKEVLLGKMGLPYVPGVPLVGIVSRLTSQKGFDLLGPVLPDLMKRRTFQLVVLGNGESGLEQMFSHFQRHFPQRVSFYRGFSNPLAHMIEAGADIFCMPSRYEPCGLNQMYSLRYGTVPVVHKTGGLADTVEPWHPATRTGTGFLFEHHDGTGLRWALNAALDAYRDKPRWRQLMLNGMSRDFSLDKQAKLYELVYERL
jgi:starch synthase